MESYAVEFTLNAKQDLGDIRAYIKSACEDERTAVRFCERLLEVALSLDFSPERGARLRSRPGTRFLVVRPYLIFYLILEHKKTVLVLRFWHGARHPRNLRLIDT